MNKKIHITSLILLLFSIALFTILGGFLDNEKYFNNYVVDFDTYNSIKSNLSRNEINNFDIKFDGYNLFFDKSDNRYYYSLIEGSKLAYNPKVELKSNYHIAINNMFITDDLISNNETIDFIIYNDRSYNEYHLTCTTLPLMNINYDGVELFVDDQPMNLVLFDNQKETINRVVTSLGNVRIRGRMTSNFDKQSMRIKLLENDWWTERKENLLGLRYDGDWILYAGYNDVDKIRNVFSMNLWNNSCASNNALKTNTGTEYKYLELFINGSYYGLYALSYPIDKKQLNLKDSDGLYQPYNHQLEGDITYDNYDKVVSNMVLKNGYDHGLLFNYYESLFKSYKEENIESIKELIDEDNAIDYFIFNNIVQGKDNASESIKNIKICIKKIDGKYKCLYIPWDYDLSFGNVSNYDHKNYTDNYVYDSTYNVVHINSPINMLIMLGDASTKDKLTKRYKELRTKQYSNDSINKIIDEYENDIYGSGAYFREMKKWPDGSYTDDEYNLNKFRNYVINRLEYLDTYF